MLEQLLVALSLLWLFGLMALVAKVASDMRNKEYEDE